MIKNTTAKTEENKSIKTTLGSILLYFMLWHVSAFIKSQNMSHIKYLQKVCLYTTQEYLPHVTEISILQCYGVERAKTKIKTIK